MSVCSVRPHPNSKQKINKIKINNKQTKQKQKKKQQQQKTTNDRNKQQQQNHIYRMRELSRICCANEPDTQRTAHRTQCQSDKKTNKQKPSDPQLADCATPNPCSEDRGGVSKA